MDDASSNIPTAGTTTTLHESDEAAAGRQLGENHAKHSFVDWPNAAGFDGLTEHRGPVDLKVTGVIPSWASGSLYRTGPGGHSVEGTRSGTFRISHWFDGLAHTHRFDILPDRADPSKTCVQYSSRRQSEAFESDIKASGTIRAMTFGQKVDPCVGIFSKFMSVFGRPRLDNVCVTVHADVPALRGFCELDSSGAKASSTDTSLTGHQALPGTVLLGTDTPWFSQLDPATMEHIRYLSPTALHPQLKGPSGPAHGQKDTVTGDFVSFNIEFGAGKATYRVFQVSAETGKTRILATFPSSPAYIHSFFLTKNYAIICVPVAHLALSGAKVLWVGSLVEAFQPFDKSDVCRWYIVDRNNGGLVAEATSPAAFFFHSANAFENADGDVVCDTVEYPNTTVVHAFYYDVLLNREGKAREFWGDKKTAASCRAKLVRYRFDKSKFHEKTNGSSIFQPQRVWEIAAPHAGDMPTINPAIACKEYRYVYTLVSRGLSTLFDAITKVDIKTRQVLQWSGPPGHTPGEAIFMARPVEGDQSADEDDGVLLSVVLDGHNGTSYLLCLDAKTMTEMGRAECDFAVGFGFHGQH
ncbi:carotenoid oxygenase, partial [Plectosphaerella plurivora]